MSELPAILQEFISTHLDAAETEHLVGWIAWRTGRQASLAGATTSARVARAIEWCSPAQQLALLTWLRRRQENGADFSPGS